MHVLGIDAGGTKTVCLLADGEGRVLSESRGGGANLQASGELQVEKVLHAVMEEARREAVAALDDAAQADALTALVNTSWEQRFGLVGIG